MKQEKRLPLSKLILSFVLLIISACSKSPEQIDYGSDECEYCRMLITDNKYGAEIITDKGKTYKFDSIECLIGFASVKNLLGGETQNILVSDFSNPGNFTDARNAHYVQNDNYRSPMGLDVSAFADKNKSDKFISNNGGQNLGWLDVIQLVMQKDM